MPVTHSTTFQRHPVTGQHRARCTCGWYTFGTLEDCQRKAAVHDIEWEAVEPAAPQPAPVPA